MISLPASYLALQGNSVQKPRLTTCCKLTTKHLSPVPREDGLRHSGQSLWSTASLVTHQNTVISNIVHPLSTAIKLTIKRLNKNNQGLFWEKKIGAGSQKIGVRTK